MRKLPMRGLWLLGLMSACQGASAQVTMGPFASGPTESTSPDTMGPVISVALKPGSTQSKLSGCIDQTKASRDEPPPEVARSRRSLPNPSVTPKPGGIVVTHPFEHGCCLKAVVDTKVKGTKVEIVERLVGEPCRCMCHSSIETTVGLTPGNYEVVVTLEVAGSRNEALRQKVTVAKR